jgi:hypothetical protein
MSYRIRHPYGRNAVVATGASTGNTRMIKATIGFQCKKTGGIVAVIAFEGCRHMKIGFTDRQNTVVAFAAVAKRFLMVDKRDYVKTKGGMTGLAHTAGSDVILRFPGYFARPR